MEGTWRAKCKTKHPRTVLDPALLEVRRPQQRKVPRCPGCEEGITSVQLEEMDLSSRELQVRGPQVLMKRPARRANLNICHWKDKPAGVHQSSKCDPISHFSLVSPPNSPGVGMGRRWNNKERRYPAHRRCITYGWISFLSETFHIHNWTKTCLETQVTRGLIIIEKWVASSGYPLKFYSEA